jgi:hypothetical protein
MALGQVQAALARLFTDEAARKAFIEDPQAAARAFGLDRDEAATLAQLAPQAVSGFARSLDAKGILDARKIMPLTARALGQIFADHFRAATAPLPAGAGRVAQTWALAQRLATAVGLDAPAAAWIGDLARYEAAFVEASHRRFGARLLLFQFPIGLIAARLQAERAVDDLAPQATLGVWARRPGGRLFHRAWPLRHWLARSRHFG